MVNNPKRYHFIAIGGSVMHNLAIALHLKGHQITGSDDEIYEPSKSRLDKHGLLPASWGWDSSKISNELEAVIVGMHAKADNPELLAAKELGIPVYSFPEFILENSRNKQRIVIAGSHGKTTVTSMIIHVLDKCNKKYDFLVGATLPGYDSMVKLEDDSPYIIIEGDEYLTSPLDLTPKFLKYEHHVGLITGISWDHINVFPTFEEYEAQFDKFANSTPKSGTLIYNQEDKRVASIVEKAEGDDIQKYGYKGFDYKVKDGQTIIKHDGERYPVKVFGAHNMSNMHGAFWICSRLGIQPKEFFSAIASFEGAGNRLEVVAEGASSIVYKDFAHSPSKLKATCEAVKGQYSKRKLVAVMELHTFSSMNKEFLAQYDKTFNAPDQCVIFQNPEVFEKRNQTPYTQEEIRSTFGNKKIEVITSGEELKKYLDAQSWDKTNLLMMSSGNFGNLDLEAVSASITN